MVGRMGRNALLWLIAIAALAVGVAILFYSDRFSGEGNPLPVEESRQSVAPTPVIAAAGDIACEPGYTVTTDTCQMQATADLIAAQNADAVLIPGDLQYDNGSLDKFRQSFEKSWGAFRSIIFPSPGNHEYGTPAATDYFEYFGTRAGEQGKGYYSFDLGSWHIVSLNSNCGGAGGCGESSPQGIWLKQDLVTHPAECTIAFWHHPRFTSGKYHPGSPVVEPFWNILYENGADVILNGHDHLYERFAPINPVGAADPEKGIRQFTVGTGGRSLYKFTTVLPTSEFRADSHFGALFLTLKEGSYDWEFATIEGETIDSGTNTCR